MLLLNDVRLHPMPFLAYFKCLMLSTNLFFVLFYNASVRRCSNAAVPVALFQSLILFI